MTLRIFEQMRGAGSNARIAGRKRTADFVREHKEILSNLPKFPLVSSAPGKMAKVYCCLAESKHPWLEKYSSKGSWMMVMHFAEQIIEGEQPYKDIANHIVIYDVKSGENKTYSPFEQKDGVIYTSRSLPRVTKTIFSYDNSTLYVAEKISELRYALRAFDISGGKTKWGCKSDNELKELWSCKLNNEIKDLRVNPNNAEVEIVLDGGISVHIDPLRGTEITKATVTEDQKPRNYYFKLLGLRPEASQIEILRAYRKLVFRYHPLNNAPGKSSEHFEMVQEAYENIFDPWKYYNEMKCAQKIAGTINENFKQEVSRHENAAVLEALHGCLRHFRNRLDEPEICQAVIKGIHLPEAVRYVYNFLTKLNINITIGSEGLLDVPPIGQVKIDQRSLLILPRDITRDTILALRKLRRQGKIKHVIIFREDTKKFIDFLENVKFIFNNDFAKIDSYLDGKASFLIQVTAPKASHNSTLSVTSIIDKINAGLEVPLDDGEKVVVSKILHEVAALDKPPVLLLHLTNGRPKTYTGRAKNIALRMAAALFSVKLSPKNHNPLNKSHGASSNGLNDIGGGTKEQAEES